jgi:hypothetical protein
MLNNHNYPLLINYCGNIVVGYSEKLIEEFVGFKDYCFGDLVKVRDFDNQAWHPRIFEKVIDNKVSAFFRLGNLSDTAHWNQCEKITHEEWVQLLKNT